MIKGRAKHVYWWGLGLLVAAGLLLYTNAVRDSQCGLTERIPSDAALRAQVIRAQLRLLLQSNADDPYRLLLIRGDVNHESMIEMLRSRSLPAWLNTAYTSLSSSQEIDALTDAMLKNDLVIVNHDINSRELTVIPTSVMKVVSEPPAVDLTLEERSRGFGRYYISILQFRFISLVCCDGLGAKQGLGESWFSMNTEKNIRGARMKFLAVNRCGELLVRDYGGGDTSHVF